MLFTTEAWKGWTLSSWMGRCQEWHPLLLPRVDIRGGRVNAKFSSMFSFGGESTTAFLSHHFPTDAILFQGSYKQKKDPLSMQQMKLQRGATQHLPCFAPTDGLPILLPWHLSAPVVGSYRANSGPSGHETEPNPDTPAGSRSTGASRSLNAHQGVWRGAAWQPACTAASLIPRETQHLGTALCFEFQQNQSFKVSPKKIVKIEGGNPDQDSSCLGSWKDFYEMSYIFTVFSPISPRVIHRI